MMFKLMILFSMLLPSVFAIEFKTARIQVGSKKIKVEIADDTEKRNHGLMFRKSLPKDEGMLFVFDRPEPLNFWMKNTVIPLSIGYFDSKKTLIDVQEMVPEASEMVVSPKIYASRGPAQYALEMNPGWFTKNKIIKLKSRLIYPLHSK